MKPWLSLVVLTYWLAGCDRLPSSSSSSSTSGAGSTVANPGMVSGISSSSVVAGRPPAPAESDTEPYKRARELINKGKLAEARALLQPLADDGAASERRLD